MGLWLKCPKCQAANPLSLKACTSCGASLDNLSEKQRIYVLTPAGSPPPQPKAAAEPAPPKAADEQDLTKPPPKKAKGPKAAKKKQK